MMRCRRHSVRFRGIVGSERMLERFAARLEGVWCVSVGKLLLLSASGCCCKGEPRFFLFLRLDERVHDAVDAFEGSGAGRRRGCE